MTEIDNRIFFLIGWAKGSLRAGAANARAANYGDTDELSRQLDADAEKIQQDLDEILKGSDEKIT